MQKLSEAPTERGDACAKKEPSRQKKGTPAPSAVTAIKIFLFASGRSNASVFRWHTS